MKRARNCGPIGSARGWARMSPCAGMRPPLALAGPGLKDILWRVVCACEGLSAAENALGWPARAGKLVLCLALDRAADYYRIPGC
jgi:hypothetical protein